MTARIFLTRPFAKFSKESRIDEESLVDAVTRAESGLVDAELGGGIIKQRIARPGAGRGGPQAIGP